ncbi:3-dehydroquinate dehydratase I [Klebsiella pneumoniae]|nr:3-dehydroquinate dehydratase I [Klebsiella pneumoniae]
MTNAVTVKNITFQEGETLICVPLIGKTLDEILGNAHGLVDAGADIIEWRVDHFAQVREMAQVMAALAEIRGALKALPLLFTFRSKKEGGETELSDEAYLRSTARPHAVDWLMLSISNCSMMKRRSARWLTMRMPRASR